MERFKKDSGDNSLFSFYRIVTDPEAGEKELKAFQYEETPEALPLKEKLEKEISKFELYRITYTDRYYHYSEHEETFSLDFSKSVFEDDRFMGYVIAGTLKVILDLPMEVYKEVRGVTSFEVFDGIRRRT